MCYLNRRVKNMCKNKKKNNGKKTKLWRYYFIFENYFENDSCTKYNKYEVLTLKMETLSTKQKSYNKISSLINDEERQKLKHL